MFPSLYAPWAHYFHQPVLKGLCFKFLYSQYCVFKGFTFLGPIRSKAVYSQAPMFQDSVQIRSCFPRLFIPSTLRSNVLYSQASTFKSSMLQGFYFTRLYILRAIYCKVRIYISMPLCSRALSSQSSFYIPMILCSKVLYSQV